MTSLVWLSNSNGLCLPRLPFLFNRYWCRNKHGYWNHNPFISFQYLKRGIHARITNCTTPSLTCSTALHAHVQVITLTEPLGANGNDNHHMMAGLNQPCGSQNTPLERYLHAMTYCGILTTIQRKIRNATVKVVLPEERFESVVCKEWALTVESRRTVMRTEFLQVREIFIYAPS